MRHTENGPASSQSLRTNEQVANAKEREMKTESGWAIASHFGLYIGWHMTRIAAIRDHIADKYDIGHRYGRLTEAQKRAWQRCRKEGDRAVRVTLTYK